MTGVPGGRQCPPWQRGLGIVLENIIECPGIFQGDKISGMCSLDSASTSPRTWRPQQHDHLSRWPGAECRESRAPGRTGPHREREPVHVCRPPHHPALGLCGPHCQAPPTDRSGPKSPSPAPPATSCSRPTGILATASRTVSVRTHLWPFLPITESTPPPSGDHMQGKIGSLKEVAGVSDAPSPRPMPTHRYKQLPWARERQKSGAPESSEETSVRHMMSFF